MQPLLDLLCQLLFDTLSGTLSELIILMILGGWRLWGAKVRNLFARR